jgi:hypothetical protein
MHTQRRASSAFPFDVSGVTEINRKTRNKHEHNPSCRGRTGLRGNVRATDVRRAPVGVTDTEITIGWLVSGQLAASADPAGGPDVEKQQEGRHSRPQDQARHRGRQVHPNDVVGIVKSSPWFHRTDRSAAPAAVRIRDAQKFPMVMLNARTSPLSTRYVFGAFGGTQRAVGGTIMEFAIKELKGKRIAYIADDNDFGNANWSVAKAVAERLGAQVEKFLRTSTTSRRRCSRSSANLIIVSTYPATVLHRRRARFTTPLAVAVGSRCRRCSPNVATMRHWSISTTVRRSRPHRPKQQKADRPVQAGTGRNAGRLHDPWLPSPW